MDEWDRLGNTALNWAYFNIGTDAIRMLAQNGAYTDIMNDVDLTPIDYVPKFNY